METNQPYQVSAAGNWESAKDLSGFTKFVLILFVIFGSLGILSGATGLLTTVLAAIATTTTTTNQPTVPPPDAGTNEDNVASEANPFDALTNPVEVFPGQIAIQFGLTFISLLGSLSMLIGAVFALQRKKVGLIVTRWNSLFWALFKMIETAVGTVVALLTINQVMATALEKMSQEADTPVEQIETVIQILVYIGLGVGVSIALALVLFYIVCFVHFGKPSIRYAFSK